MLRRMWATPIPVLLRLSSSSPTGLGLPVAVALLVLALALPSSLVGFGGSRFANSGALDTSIGIAEPDVRLFFSGAQLGLA
jgi:hypothetical protein